MKYKIIIAFLICSYTNSAFCQESKMVLLNPAHMISKKTKYKDGEATTVKEVNIVIKTANDLLDDKPVSVMDKAFVPSSGSKHDYMSLAPYFWPDPTKADGLPYIRKDGEHNPETKKITDDEYLNELSRKCKFLSLAYYFTGDEKYPHKASELLKVWFIDTATRMNPNLQYAQAIRGVNDGRGIGIIESRCLISLIDWMALMEGSKSFTIQAPIKNWYRQYLNWLLNSKNGTDERNAKNNHGTHYDTQVLAYAIYTGDVELAKKILDGSKKRIDIQIEPDGEQKMELERTNALGYSTLNLTAWTTLAMLAEKVQVDIWNYKSADGRCLQKAFEWLAPYALGEKPWTEYKQIIPYKQNDFYQPLILSAKVFKETDYIKKANEIKKNNDLYVVDLLFN
jgi:hypothetical protein